MRPIDRLLEALREVAVRYLPAQEADAFARDATTWAQYEREAGAVLSKMDEAIRYRLERGVVPSGDSALDFVRDLTRAWLRWFSQEQGLRAA